MSEKKGAANFDLFSDEGEMQYTSSYSSSGQKRRKKGGKRSNIMVINSGTGAFDPLTSASYKSSSPYYSNTSTSQSTLPKQPQGHSERSPLLPSSPRDDLQIQDCMEDSYQQAKNDPDEFRFTPIPSHFNTLTPEVRPRRAHELSHKEFDSLDYDISYNVPYKEQLRNFRGKTYLHMEAMRWVLVCIIGILTGLVAFGINEGVKFLFILKYSYFEKVMEMTLYNGWVAMGFLVLLGFNVVFVLVAAFLIVYEPVAAGSGIPEIRCYLNGVKVPHVTRIGTLIAKAVGVLFSVAGGFLVGKEEPMIHSGAIIGAGLPQFRSFVFNIVKLPYHYFRSDRDKRDFVSCGAAAGVAAAFGAPIGGVLFSLEEGSSFWNQSLTWKTLFCCFSATFTLNFLNSILDDPKEVGFLGSPSLVDFGVFDKEEKRLWNAYHLIIFVAMGAVGGLLGALFNSLNINLTKYRMKYLAKRRLNRIWGVFEVVLIAMVTTTTIFVVAMSLGTCLRVCPQENTKCGFISGDQTFTNETKDFFCPGHSAIPPITKFYYNDMATLMFNSLEEGIKQLFHQNGAFTLPTLLILFIFYFFIACWTYGAGVPSGLFIPCLMIGATYGRFMATVFAYMAKFSPHWFGWLYSLYPGTYALIGAAAFLGGVVRMIICLTVILIESTNKIEYSLPILLTVMVAKWVGDIFNKGIYDTHIELRKTPFLERESPRQLDKLIAKDVMTCTNVSFLYPITRVRSIVQLLKTSHHSGFLVVSPVKAGTVRSIPKSVKQVVPQLYMRQSMIVQDDQSPLSSRHTHTPSSFDKIEEEEKGPDERHGSSSSRPENVVFSPSIDEDIDICQSYTLPSHRRSVFSDPTPPGTASTSGQSSEGGDELVFRGLILRHQLVMLIKNKIFFNEGDGPETQKKIDHVTLTHDYPRYPSIFSVQNNVTETEKNMLMDLSIFMNPSPYTISESSPLPQVFNLFRTMGLRHLPVLKENGLMAGIITRHDLTHERLHNLRHRKKLRQRAQSTAYQETGCHTAINACGLEEPASHV